jgi:hypothetical protein
MSQRADDIVSRLIRAACRMFPRIHLASDGSLERRQNDEIWLGSVLAPTVDFCGEQINIVGMLAPTGM